ncbi:hypothetical protein MST22_11930 [Virgibacillus halodenitrificans]|uniref:hypothetical protein n=1 Tax=Virgibacillus halodenitrificans TaxID=1482 RepID=UPI001FB377C9|nr:hypothetical protein [Virgibacillus halodenitrificans]MCJ0931861.1 hypothetical protein [Virgibacillus halodenitrificans]
MNKKSITEKNLNATKVEFTGLNISEQRKNDTTKLTDSIVDTTKLKSSIWDTTKLTDSIVDTTKHKSSRIQQS